LNAYGATYTWGNTGTSAAAAGADTRNTEGNFNKWNYDLRRQQRLTDDASILFSVSGQVASRNLASAEKFSLGGPNGVRAYPVGEATADTGTISTAELRYIIPGFKVIGGDVTLLAFYDYGWARVNEQPLPTDAENTRSIAGAGIGVTAGQEGSFIVRANASWRTSNDNPQSDTVDRVPRVWVQAIKWF